METNKTIVIVGPTGSGKTNLSIQLSCKTKRVIVNFDSKQFWKNCRQISCSPSVEEQQIVPHLLFNILKNNEKPNLGWFINQIKKIKSPKILVGGSVFYLRSLILGVPMVTINKEIQREVSLFKDPYAILQNIDPYTKIQSNDLYRINRFLEFYLQTNCTFQNFKNKYQEDLFIIVTSINTTNILNRTTKNFQQYVDEIIINGNVDNFNSIIGYQDCLDYIKGIINKKECINIINQKTMKYAKHQSKFITQLQNHFGHLAKFVHINDFDI